MNGDIVRKATLVMFGGTGDLAVRKLLPALFHNWKRKLMQDCLIVAVGRRCEDLPDYLKFVQERVDEAQEHSQEWTEFAKQIAYHRGEIKTTDDFQKLRVSYLRGASGYLLVADGTRRTTLDTAIEVQRLAGDTLGPVPFILVVNKADLRSQWEIDATALDERRHAGWRVLETSAKTGEMVEGAFTSLASDMVAVEQ